MKVLVIGANGNTGTRVVRRLVAHPAHMPLAMIRDPAQRTKFDELGAPTVLADLEYPIDHAVAGSDAVIFAAGSGGHTGKDKTVLIDHIGAIRAAVTALVQQAHRFIMLSALNADARSDSRIPHYHRAKGLADDFIRQMPQVMDGQGLDWTTVHPGGLYDEPGPGGVTVSSNLAGTGRTSREDLAAALVACLDLPNAIGKSFTLLDGDTPIDQALRTI